MTTLHRRTGRRRPLRFAGAVTLAAVALLGACADELPEAFADYAARCVLMNPEPIPPYAGDPHLGFKDVYACGVAEDALLEPDGGPLRDYPVGAVIIKESVRDGATFPWLVAVADKRAGGWAWAEYTRNFADEALLRIPVSESVCTDCHRRARTTDWIFTRYGR